MEINEIITNIKSGKIDMNNMELFMSAMIKGFLYNINQELVLRGE